MFDFDPDDLYEAEATEEEIEDLKEEIEDLGEEIEEEVDDSIVEKAIMAGAIFGMGVEEGSDSTETKKEVKKGERSPDAVSLHNMKESGKEEKMRPFEQWVDDFVHGRKRLTDGL